MPAPTIAALPTAPSRNQAPDAFTTTADAFVGALSPFRSQLNALVAYLNSTAMVLGQFQDGTPAAPSIRFESDQDNGFYRIGPNQMGLAQGGVGLGQLFARGNILGTVSQSGGVPTGAVMERGSNANGEYLRFANGTQICWQIIGSTDAIATASGQLFTSAADYTWSYPAVFSTAVTVAVSGGFLRSDRVGGISISSRGATSANFKPWVSVTVGAGAATTSFVTAIGHWF